MAAAQALLVRQTPAEVLKGELQHDCVDRRVPPILASVLFHAGNYCHAELLSVLLSIGQITRDAEAASVLNRGRGWTAEMEHRRVDLLKLPNQCERVLQ